MAMVHTSINVIQFARENGIRILCLPAHTTHILQPLDVGVFKSFKATSLKRVPIILLVTPGVLLLRMSLVAEAWPHSFTLLNVMSGFKKCGLFPFNPSAMDDRQSAPSKAFQATPTPEPTAEETITEPSSPLFTKEQESLYSKRYEEGYDLDDPGFVAWLKINHPDKCVSVTSAPSFSSNSSPSGTSPSAPPSGRTSCSSDVLSEVLVLPHAEAPKRKKKTAMNCRAVCITDNGVLQELEEKERKRMPRRGRGKRRNEKEKKKTNETKRDRRKEERD